MTMLPVRPKPQVDESFTSWLIRVANANGIPVGTFCHFLSKHQHFFTRDADRPTDKQIVCDLARLTGTPISAAAETTIHLLERRVFPMLKPNNVQQMITVLGVYHRTHRKYGQAFCPQCLADEGYYRLSWRLVFITQCTTHSQRLHDRCCQCGEPVCLHRSPWHTCHSCGFDRREAEALPIDSHAERLQKRLEQGFRTGTLFWDVPMPSPQSYAKLVYDLMSILHHRAPRVARLREVIREMSGGPEFSFEGEQKSQRLESLSCEDRHKLMAIAGRALQDWPWRLIAYAMRADCWHSFLLKDLKNPHPALSETATRYLTFSPN
jgi:hypothetical protein